ncbi:membrane dipeptidase [Verrucomicrobium sp. BvORR034]|uniref:dipeptidase n=1 Tax=Verrucomicrobium sp. BvORR034 TaxID=1396418 RepID=UPI0006799918|nr:membrane dipeptidase [Verrucomicrobium sp. BvORR034]
MSLSRRQLLRRTVHTASALVAAPLFNIHVRAQEAGGIWRTGNDVIDRARETALNLLKPTQAQMDRAWELHHQSLVLDSYAFAPRAAIDGEKFQAAVEAGASPAELVDLREEMSMTRSATDPAERKEFMEAFRAAGVTCIFQNAGEEGNDPLRLIKRLARFTQKTDLMKPEVTKAVTAEDVENTRKAGGICLLFTTNGVPLRGAWESTRDELRLVRIFQQLGVRMMHVTYNRRNPLGDGAGEPDNGGLSDFGHQAVAELNRAGVIVDVAHSGWRTSLEAAKASTKPMVASHTSCASLYKHFRGKPDEVIQAICDTDGLVGICCISRFLGGKGDIVAMMDHLDHLLKKFGPTHVAIGTDVGYLSRFDKAERLKVKRRADGSSPLSTPGPSWEHLWPKDDFQTTLEAEQSLAWTNWPLFTLGLVMRGHKDDDIRAVLGQNMLRVLRAQA